MQAKRFVNSYLMNLRPYKTVSQEIWSLGPDEWQDVLKLDWNEATIEPAPAVKEAILDLVSSCGCFHLYPSTFNRRLLELLAQYAKVPALNIQYFAGSDSLHEYIAKLYIGAGDKVLILWPSYDNFRSTAEMNGADIVYSEMDSDFTLDFARLRADIRRERPKLVYICNPNNPTGVLIPKGMIQELVAETPETMFLIDEAYAEFAGQSVNGLTCTYENILVTHTMSKAFGLANVRFGYLVSSPDNIDAINRIRNAKNIQTISQVAAIAALEHADYMWRYVEEVNAAREWFYQQLSQSGFPEIKRVYPSASNFLLVQCRDLNTKSRICYALRERKIYVRQLSQSASVLNCIRITIGTQSQMERVYNALAEILSAPQCEGPQSGHSQPVAGIAGEE